jgi:NAD(P)-dependent dehydrogenase (short-subunit alcohol dehydrogenase family)
MASTGTVDGDYLPALETIMARLEGRPEKLMGYKMKNESQIPDLETYFPPADLLQQRVILVTGASDGIGRAAAMSYAQHGATVILLGRTKRKLEKLYDEIIAAGAPRPAIVQMDLARAQGEHFQALVDGIAEEHGRLDGLLHNAGILGDMTPIEHYDIATWQRVLHINLTAPFVLTRTLMPLLKASPDASVVFISSGVGRKGRAYWGAYAVSKFGIEGLAEVLAEETEARENLRVNTLNPGAVRTQMRYLAMPGEDRDRLRRPEEIMAPYLFLMGPDSRGVHGQRIDCQPKPKD